MHIDHNRLKGVRFKRARKYGPIIRRRKFIVAHSTSGSVKQFSTVNYLSGKYLKGAASYHFVIERDGTITQMVPLDRKAYHAGKSSWKGYTYLNSNSIGIGLVGPGHLKANGMSYFHEDQRTYGEIVHKATPEHGDHWWLPYTDEQIRAFIKLSRALVEWDADLNEILTHWEISPGRKIDPNPLFPLEHVRKQVFDPTEIDDDEDEVVAAPPVKSYDGKTMATSKVATTAVVQGTAGTVVTTVAVLEKAANTAEKADKSADTLLSALADPIVLIGLGIVLFAAFFWHDRRTKMKDYGV